MNTIEFVPIPDFAPDAPKGTTTLNDGGYGFVRAVYGLHAGRPVNPTASGWYAAAPQNEDHITNGITLRRADGVHMTFVGNAARLYRREPGWNNHPQAIDATRYTSSPGDDNYATVTGNIWQFCQYGQYVIAVNGSDKPQYFLMGTSSYFDDLDDIAGFSGTLPTAKYVITSGEFLVFAYGNTVQWSGLGNIAEWTPGEQGADIQEIADSGNITGLAPFQNGFLVATERNIQYFEFVGGTYTFIRRPVNESVGCAAPYSFVVANGEPYWLSGSGFRRGVAAAKIGDGRVDDYFIDGLIDAKANMTTQNPYDYVFGFYDSIHDSVAWMTRNGTYFRDAHEYRGIAYSYSLDRWTPNPYNIAVRAAWVSVVSEADSTPMIEYVDLANNSTICSVESYGGEGEGVCWVWWFPKVSANVHVSRIRFIGDYLDGRLSLTNYYDQNDELIATFAGSGTPGPNRWFQMGISGHSFLFRFFNNDSDPSVAMTRLSGFEVEYSLAGEL